MRISSFILVFCLGLSIQAVSQANYSTLYNQHFNLMGSKVLPSKLGMDYSIVQISFMNVHSYAANTSIRMSSLTNLTGREINNISRRLKKSNVIAFGTDVDWLSVSYDIRYRKKEILNVSANVTERIGFTQVYPKAIAQLVLEGNEQFAGSTVPLGPFSLGAYYLREFGIGLAAPYTHRFYKDKMEVRGATRLKYIQGMASVYTKKAQADMYTEEEGRYIDFNYDYNLNYSVNTNGFSPNERNGAGFGIDFGGTVTWDNTFKGSLAVVDIGYVRFDRNTTHVEGNGLARFEGVVVTNIFKQANFAFDSSFVNSLKGKEIKGEAFNMPLPTRLIIQGEYKIVHDPNEKGGRKIDDPKYDKEFNKNTIYFTYIQGFNNVPGATTRPMATVGYSHSFGYFLNAGGMFTVGGYNTLALGGFASMRLGHWRLGIGSSNLTYFLYPKYSTGADLSFNTGFAF